MTTTQMIQLLEQNQRIPGTIIQRTLSINNKLIWCIGIGELQQPKIFRFGPTIHSTLKQFPKIRRTLTNQKRSTQ